MPAAMDTDGMKGHTYNVALYFSNHLATWVNCKISFPTVLTCLFLNGVVIIHWYHPLALFLFGCVRCSLDYFQEIVEIKLFNMNRA